MTDLNNLFYFAKIVEHGSLSATAQALGVAKSVLSQHLSKLEADLGVRLIQRTTRKLQITEVGRRYYERCRAVLGEVERASNVIDDVRDIPRGRVRVSCPLNFAQVFVAPVLAAFMAEYPEVEVVLDVSNRDIDMVAEGYDLALRIAPDIKSSSLIVRSFTLNKHQLIASRDFIQRHGHPQRPEDLKDLPSMGGTLPVERGGRYLWHLTGPAGETRTVHFHPRLISEDLFVLKEAVLAGCGIADFQPSLCADEIADGRLVRVLPHWQLPELSLYAVYPSRQGLPLAVRMLIDHLAEHLKPMLDSVTGGSFRVSLVPPVRAAPKFGT
jgi:DNA-binding transcriptional LysR family regulator